MTPPQVTIGCGLSRIFGSMVLSRLEYTDIGVANPRLPTIFRAEDATGVLMALRMGYIDVQGDHQPRSQFGPCLGSHYV